jgi:hypothetical protein
LTDRQGQPLRQAEVMVSGTETRTDGDGRFFMQTAVPSQAQVVLQVRLAGLPQVLEMRAPIERHQFNAQAHASMALTLAV